MAGRWLVALLLGVVLVVTASPARAGEQVQPVEPVEIVLFHLSTCPHCGAERAFLDELQAREPDVVVRSYEVGSSAEGRALYLQASEEHGFEPGYVPVTIIGDQVWIGFDDGTARQIEEAVDALLAGEVPPEVEDDTTVDVPFVGAVDVGDRSLLVATVLIGFVDGVNPCSLWVLSMLLALVLHSGSRTRVFAVGAVFLAITSLLYGLYMLGAFTVLDYASELVWIRPLVASVAVVFGLFHLKEYFAVGAGPSLAIPAERKPGMYRRMRMLADPERSVVAVLGGTTVLAIGVSLVETPCTAGLPVLWSNLVSSQGVGWAGASLLFVVYLAVFLLDELVVFGVAVTTMRAAKLQERHGRALQLVSGAVLVVLGVVLAMAPELLESLVGTLTVFGVAAGLVAIGLLVDRRREARSRPSASHRGGSSRHGKPRLAR